ncbi:actin [Diplonema papillatum]|nr:actin [Diplonema papillatum]
MADPHVIMDIGTVNTRMGFGGEDKPSEVFPTVVGEVRSEFRDQSLASLKGNNALVHVGKMVLDKRSVCKVRNPVEMGVPKVDVDLERIVAHGLKSLGSSRRIVLVEPTQATKKLREELVDMIFENTDAEEAWLCASTALTLYGSGRTTGCVLEAGESYAHVVPFLEGYALSRRRWQRSELCGLSLTCCMEYFLQTAGRVKETLHDYIKRNIKEKHVYTSLNYEDDRHHWSTNPEEILREYTLPDGRLLTLGDERFVTGEVFFNPSSWNGTTRKTLPIHRSIAKCITGCDERLQPKLLQNIVPSGGVTLMRGFQARLQQEITTWLNSPDGRDTKQRCNFHRVQMVDTSKKGSSSINGTVCIQPWRGASILSQLSTFDALKVTRGDVKENGVRVVHKKEMVSAAAE